MAPDLVLADSFSDPNTIAMIRRIGIRVATLEAPTGFDGIIANVRQVAELLGERQRGEVVVAEIEAALANSPVTDGTRPVVAVLEPGGYIQGVGSLIDEAVSRAGGLSLGRKLGVRDYGALSVERLVAAPIDLLILPGGTGQAPSLKASMLNHPALRERFAATPRLAIPGNLIDCPAPASAALVPMIRRALDALDGAVRP